MNLLTNKLHYLIWLLALGLATWVLSLLPVEALLEAIANLSASQWLLWAGLNLLIIALLVGRWLVMTRVMNLSVNFGQLLRIRQAGQLVSFVTPGPQFGGEPLQVYWLWKHYRTPGHAAFLAVGLDRFYELWINFAVLLLAVLALAGSATSTLADWRLIASILFALVAMLAGLAWFLLRHPQKIESWIKGLTRNWQAHPRLGQLHGHWSQLHTDLQALINTQRPALLLALLLSLLGWLGMIAEFYLLLHFVGIDFELSRFVLLFTVVRLAFLLPLPGGIGSVEAGLLWAFQLLALPLSAAAGLIALMRLRDVLVLLAGALLLPGLSTIATDIATDPVDSGTKAR